MRTSSEGSAISSVLCQIFKSILCTLLIGHVAICVATPMPQRSNVLFPSTNNNGFNQGNELVATGLVPPPPPSEFQAGSSGIPCETPGVFVKAPDGCNRCFCAENRQLSSACSRVFCPPGFPSSSQGQFRLSREK